MDTPIDRLIAHFGNVNETAKAFGYDRQLIDMWRRRGIPFKRGTEVERISGGKIKAIEVWEAAAKGNLSA
mgnify:FL=1